jgi:NADPH:quinone reductase-like Zn-dependent oxidoreductase
LPFRLIKVRLAGLRSSQKTIFYVANFNTPDMTFLQSLLEARKVIPVIDRRYELSEVAEAFRYLGEGRAKGKIVITM